MNFNCSQELKNKLQNYMASLDRKARHEIDKVGMKDFRFWPAVSTGCEYREIKECDSSGRWKQGEDPIHPVIRTACLGLGVDIEEEINGNLNGCCAEDHAASDVITQNQRVHGRILSIPDLTFTKAIRPRTRKVIKPCTNCRIVFQHP